jgi:hypothetical protein
MWHPPRIELDIFYFVVCPALLTVGLFVLLRQQAHWLVELGVSLLVALIAGIAWVASAGGPFGFWTVVFFFLIPFSGIFLASRIGVVQRHPWSVLITAPLFYVIGVFVAASIWTKLLVHPL